LVIRRQPAGRSPLPPAAELDYPCGVLAHRVAIIRFRRTTVESHGTLGTIWASFGMTAYYMALTWINILLGLFLSPLFVIPLTWLKQKQGGFES
jgi:hypothetical protein